jgi:hypothetical protein
MAGDYRPVLGDKHRVGPAPLSDRGRDLADLCVAMCAGVAGEWDQPFDWPSLNVIRRFERPFSPWQRTLNRKLDVMEEIGQWPTALLDPT